MSKFYWRKFNPEVTNFKTKCLTRFLLINIKGITFVKSELKL